MTIYIHLIPEAYSEGKHGIPKGMLVVDLIFIPAIEMAGYIISMPKGIWLHDCNHTQIRCGNVSRQNETCTVQDDVDIDKSQQCIPSG